MLRNKEQQKNVDMDERQNPIMTLRTLKYYCQKEGLFSTPEHNDKLYLQYKGFLQIVPETLSLYHNLVALWLDHNCISQITGLNQLINLTSLALNNNFISKIEGLQNLINLSILNLSHNKIEVVEGLDSLRKLQTLNLAHNFVTSASALEGISQCQLLSSLDLSSNELQCSEDTLEQIVSNQNLSCLYLKATPLSRGFRNYRKRLVAELKRLKFLDDRPVLQQDHRLSEAWMKGGPEMENEQRQKIALEKQQKQAQQRSQKIASNSQSLNQKPKPAGFIASIKETSIKIMNVEDQAEEERIINQYFQREKEEVEKNIRKQKEREEREKQLQQDAQIQQNQLISQKVKEILWHNRDSEEDSRLDKAISSKWKPKYEPILETLLLRYKFDFGQVQPFFNMIVANVNRRMLKAPQRFEIDELRRIWTQIELKKRQIRH